MSSAMHLPFSAELPAYEQQAVELLAGHAAGHPQALAVLNRTHPRFLHAERTWQPLDLPASAIREAELTLDDTRLAVARAYAYADWESLRVHVTAMHTVGTPEYAYERAVEAALDGDVDTLGALLAADPLLVRARSARVTCHDPPTHAATVLHYLGANGVETYRQRSPANAVAMARMLLEAGADPNALAHMYGGDCCLLSLLVSSSPPAEAGVQVALVHALLEGGADVEGASASAWASPLLTALTFGFVEAAQTLVSHGARVDTLVKAAGLGLVEEATALLAEASALERHQALALAVLTGRHSVVELLLERGEDPSRYNPAGFHAHQTPLHGAAFDGDLAMVQLLVAHGARRDIADRIYGGTPLDWARHGEQAATVAYLLALRDGGAE